MKYKKHMSSIEKETNDDIIQLVKVDVSDVDHSKTCNVNEFEEIEKTEEIEESREELVVTSVLESAIRETKSYVCYTYNATSIYFFWILMHYFSSQLYVYYCTPQGFYGFFISPFLVAAPHCRALRWIIHSGGNMVDNMWIILGTWLCSKMLLNK